jgi:lantibiotic biosynthesis protein
VARQASTPTPSPTPALEPAGFFAWRTPLLPFDELLAWSEGVSAPSAERATLGAALASDRRLLRERLRAAVTRPEVREALYIASRSLDESLATWLAEPESERGQKVERTLVRYFSRMASRATPFGLFAGCSLGSVGATTELVVDARTRYRRNTRLDGDYLATLTDALGGDAGWRRAATFRPSSSLYRAAGRLRYAKARLDGKLRSYSLVAVEPSAAIDDTLSRAESGSRLDPLIDALVGDDITRDEAAEFVNALVDEQILVSDLVPQVTGAEPIHDLIAQLSIASGDGGDGGTRPVAERLAEVRRALAELDATPLGAPPARYEEIATILDALPVEVDRSRLFQVDMVKPAAAATLGPEPIAELLRGVALLHRLAPPNDPLANFRQAFQHRYEAREVPLTDVLDEESGIGFERSEAPTAEDAPLLDGLVFPGGVVEEKAPVTPRLTLLLSKLATAWRSGALSIELEEADLETLAAKEPPPLPDSMAAMATLSAASPEALARGRFELHLHGVFGPSGANFLGRFCHRDPALTAEVLAHLRAEEAARPDAVFAEIVHLPEGRIGNVLLRPLLRRYEIPFLGRSGAPLEQQIAVTDLLVSVVGQRVILRSRRLGREVIPRLTTAHNFSSPGNLGVYRFLCALQFQQVASLAWRWDALATAPFLPRVTAGRLVLSLASWRLDKTQLTRLADARGDDRFAAVRALRETLRLPRWVSIADGDNVLPVDLDNALAVDNLVELVRARPAARLTEVFPQPDALLARGPEGRFAHELVVPLLRRAAAPATVVPTPPTPRATTHPSTLPRTRLPGSEWLFVKLYTGAATADQLLVEMVAPLVAALKQSTPSPIDGWFFLRYGDPDWHVRLRFSGQPQRLREEVLPRLAAAAEQSFAGERLWKLQIDTYERELDRYGGDVGMQLSEALFAADSDAVLGIVETLSGDAGADARWRLALRGMDQLLDDLGFTVADKHALLTQLRAGFGAELHADSGFEKQLGDRFRKERLALEGLLDRAQDEASDFAPGLALFAERSRVLAPVVAELRAAAAAGQLTASLPELAGSYLHMHANRLLRSAARAQELVLYDFLERLYRSQLARARRR